jgi:peptidoglycan/LPS O-acetylase OafA/YrhL
MLQRIQSIWLLLAAIGAALTFKFEYYSGINLLHPILYKIKAAENFPILLLTVAVSALALITIFLFKNRTLQLRLCVLGIVLEAVLIFLYYTQVKLYTDGTYSIWAILHGLVVLLFFLAARGIRRDEKIIKDSDRLR